MKYFLYIYEATNKNVIIALLAGVPGIIKIQNTKLTHK